MWNGDFDDGNITNKILQTKNAWNSLVYVLCSEFVRFCTCARIFVLFCVGCDNNKMMQ